MSEKNEFYYAVLLVIIVCILVISGMWKVVLGVIAFLAIIFLVLLIIRRN